MTGCARIVFVHSVELLAGYVSLMLYVFKLLLSWVKHFPCENLFFFGHDFLLVLFMMHKIMSDYNLAAFSAGRPTSEEADLLALQSENRKGL